MRPHRWQPTRLPHPWDSPGKNIGVGCHFLLQRMKVKSESEVPQPCLTLSDPMDRSLPSSSVHGIFQARVLEWGVPLLSLTIYHILLKNSITVRIINIYAVQFSSIAQLCPTLCDPMNNSMPGLPVHHQLSESPQTHVHWVSNAIQSSHSVIPFSSCLQSFPASGSFQMSQLFASGGQSIGVSASTLVLPMNTQDWSMK